MEEAGPESCARGLALHGIDHGDGPGCSDGRYDLRLAALVSTHHLRGCFWRQKGVCLEAVSMMSVEVYARNRG